MTERSADSLTVVSVSLGSSRRDFQTEAEYLGRHFHISRVGVDGDWDAYGRKLRELDGAVDAIGLGGLDLHLWADGRRYTFHDVRKLVRQVRRTPVVDGSGLKNTLEREAVRWLQQTGVIDLKNCNTLVVCAVDRFGMAEEVAAAGGPAVYGDLMFNLGIPVPIRSWGKVRLLARLLLPIVVRMPFQWLYPTGAKQESVKPKYGSVYSWADVIAGDFHLIRRYMPQGEGSLAGKTILTNTTTLEDREELRRRGVRQLITTTRSFGGRSAGTNVLEAVLVAALKRDPEDLRPEDYQGLLRELGWRPEVNVL